MIAVQGITGHQASDASEDGKRFTYRITVPFTVMADSPAATEADILSADGMPQLRDALATSPWYRCTGRNARKLGAVYWQVDCEFASESGTKSPIDMSPRLRWRSFTTDDVIDTDSDGNPICTSLGEPFQGVTAPQRTLVLEIEKNLLTFNDGVMAEYLDATNSDSWYGSSPGQLLMADISAEEVHSDDFTYYATHVEIWKRWYAPGSTPAKTWYKRILHQGFRYAFLAAGQFVVINGTDRMGEPITEPLLLKDNGELVPMLPDGSGQDVAQAVWKEFKIYRSRSFGALGLL